MERPLGPLHKSVYIPTFLGMAQVAPGFLASGPLGPPLGKFGLGVFCTRQDLDCNNLILYALYASALSDTYALAKSAFSARALPIRSTTQLLSAYRREKDGKELASSARVASFSQDLDICTRRHINHAPRIPVPLYFLFLCICGSGGAKIHASLSLVGSCRLAQNVLSKLRRC
jgi:hypothetical protein